MSLLPSRESAAGKINWICEVEIRIRRKADGCFWKTLVGSAIPLFSLLCILHQLFILISLPLFFKFIFYLIPLLQFFTILPVSLFFFKFFTLLGFCYSFFLFFSTTFFFFSFIKHSTSLGLFSTSFGFPLHRNFFGSSLSALVFFCHINTVGTLLFIQKRVSRRWDFFYCWQLLLLLLTTYKRKLLICRLHSMFDCFCSQLFVSSILLFFYFL